MIHEDAPQEQRDAPESIPNEKLLRIQQSESVEKEEDRIELEGNAESEQQNQKDDAELTTADEAQSNNQVVFGSSENPDFIDMYNNCNSPRKGQGIIILSFVGLLANDMFEVAFANRLAKELCWKVIFRPGWNHELPNPRGHECLPHALWSNDHRILPELDPSLKKELDLDQERWTKSIQSQNALFEWLDPLVDQGKALKLKHMEFQFKQKNATERLIHRILTSPNIKVLSLHGFFINYDWMQFIMDDVRRQLAFNPDCCLNTPPEDAVVFHIREFDVPRDGGFIQNEKIYPKLMEHYNWSNRTIWVVCQPKTVDSPAVRAIADTAFAASGKNITIVPGVDQYDAFCTLSRSKVLVGSAASSYSQMGALLAGAEFHIPIPTKNEPRVTIDVPGWKYHKVSGNKVDIERYDLPNEKITFKTA